MSIMISDVKNIHSKSSQLLIIHLLAAGLTTNMNFKVAKKVTMSNNKKKTVTRLKDSLLWQSYLARFASLQTYDKAILYCSKQSIHG